MGLAKQLGLNKFILQSDNIQVIETMIEGGNAATAAAAIFLPSLQQVLLVSAMKIVLEKK